MGASQCNCNVLFCHNVSSHHLCASGTNTFIWMEALRSPNPFVPWQNLHAISPVKENVVLDTCGCSTVFILGSISYLYLCSAKLMNLVSLLTQLVQKELWGLSCKDIIFLPQMHYMPPHMLQNYLVCSIWCQTSSVVGKVIFPFASFKHFIYHFHHV